MKRCIGFAVLVLALVAMVGCGSSSSTKLSQGNNAGALFVTAEDAPLSSVVGFQLTINSLTLNGQNHSPVVISTATTVDFARLLGLRSPLAFNSVPPDTYTGATFVVSSPVITYIDMTQNPPALNTIQGTLPQSPFTIKVTFPTPMVVGSNELAGLRVELNIRQSLTLDSTGNVLPAVTPVIHAKATKASDPDGHITDLMGGLVSVNAANNSFVLQGPYGRQLTIDVNSSTQFNSGWNINNLAAPAFIAVQGRFQADGSLLADNVEVITTAHSFLSGRVLAVSKNSSGQAQKITMWVGETGADLVADVDTIQTIDVSAVTRYDICFMSNILTNAFFNSSSVEVGQRIFIGGDFASSIFTPTMISLRLQGLSGTFVPGSVLVTNVNAGSFKLTNNGLLGYLLGAPIMVNTFNGTDFDNLSGLSQLQTTTTAVPLVTRGLLLKNPVSGNAELYAGMVTEPETN